VRQPQVFLMGEPLSNLDDKLRVQTRTQIASLQRRLSFTTAYVTHDQAEALTMGDRIAVLKDGVFQQVGGPRDLYESPQNVFVAGFIGSPAMNLFDANVVDGGLQFGTTVAAVDRESLAGASSARVTTGIRPEDVRVSMTGEGLPVDVDVVARVDGRNHSNAGDRVVISPEPNHIRVFDTE
jgi:multiple sugar transport system ATP-binding protein